MLIVNIKGVELEFQLSPVAHVYPIAQWTHFLCPVLSNLAFNVLAIHIHTYIHTLKRECNNNNNKTGMIHFIIMLWMLFYANVFFLLLIYLMIVCYTFYVYMFFTLFLWHRGGLHLFNFVAFLLAITIKK